MESVEDEWERGLEADEDLDLLFVKYQPDLISMATLIEVIQKQGFQATVQVEE